MRAGRLGVDMVVTDPEIRQQSRARMWHIGKNIGLKAVADGRQHRIVIAQRGAEFFGAQHGGVIAQGHVEPGGGGGQNLVGQAAGDQQFRHQNSFPPKGTA